ncbi:hypothetical protein GCM10011391_04330 [Pullulanibacillus camelliae]|uniref:Uncharacterized protein n=1 Tax=Pullulanibacillus camelliae TaxID=1707096 RepID=A0A8J2YFF6_9BACL|nr:hypothetical protein [Pullulanibacillus camelliae]GGE28903.1 hypothetical protein GCM10011391_04330 [Pullulanibacillus camelliae]
MDDQFQYFPWVNINAEDDTKLMHDRYEVYVNDDYIGNKTLIAQNEQIEDLNRFLNEQGLYEFSSDFEGDHVSIVSDTQADRIKEALHIHLQNS